MARWKTVQETAFGRSDRRITKPIGQAADESSPQIASEEGTASRGLQKIIAGWMERGFPPAGPITSA